MHLVPNDGTVQPSGFVVVFANNIAGSCTESMLLRVVAENALCCPSSGGAVVTV